MRRGLYTLGACVTAVSVVGLWSPRWAGSVIIALTVTVLLLILYLVSGKAE